jgi:hypothetical protein
MNEGELVHTLYKTVLWIRDFLVRIWIPVPLTYGSGSCSPITLLLTSFFKEKCHEEVTKHKKSSSKDPETYK